MIPLVKLREDMRFGQELLDIVEVLKGATASQFRSLQRRTRGFEHFKTRLEDFLSTVDLHKAMHPFLRDRSQLPKAIVMITSDEGFLGSLNAMVINAGLEQASSSDELIILGERGARYLSDTRTQTYTFLPGIGDDITYTRAVAVRELLIGKFLKREVGSVLVSFPRFVSLTSQRVEVARILPCRDIFGTGRDIKKGHPAVRPWMMLEPSEGKVVDYLVKVWMMQRLYDIFWESKLSECAARIIHLEGSHE